MRCSRNRCNIICHLILHTDLRQCDTLVCVNLPHTPIFEYRFFRLTSKHSRRNRTQFFLQFLAGKFYCFSCYIGSRRCIRTGIIRRCVRICTKYCHVIHRAVHTLSHHLCQNRITAGSHICRTDDQVKRSIICQFHSCGTDIDVGYTGTLHRHRNTGGPHFSIAHLPDRIFLFPAKKLTASCHTAVKRAGICSLSIIRRHLHALPEHIFLPNLRRVDAKRLRKLIDRGLQSKDSLGCAIAAISARRHCICIDNIVTKPERLKSSCIKRN